VRLLSRLGDHIAQREVEVLAVIFPTLFPEHGKQAAHRVFPDVTLVAETTIERMQLGHAAALANAEFDTAVAEQIERAHPFRHARRIVRGELHNAMTEPDVRGALTRCGEEHFGS
jgi:hypothetical protein